MPFTRGDRRTIIDVLIYAAVLVTVVVALFAPRVTGTDVDASFAGYDLVNPTLFWSILGFPVPLGLRDKVAFIATRPEQYMPAMPFFALPRRWAWST